MVSFQFRQGINAKSLARHQNGTIKHFKSEIEHQNPKPKLMNSERRKSRANERFLSFNRM